MSAEDKPELSPSPIPPPKKMEGNYTQINVLFPSNQVELPSAEKFKDFPVEAQKAILSAFEREQSERHVWLKNQQSNEHALNMQSGRHYYRWRLAGTVCGTAVVIAALGFGSWLVAHGASCGRHILNAFGHRRHGKCRSLGQRSNYGSPRKGQRPQIQLAGKVRFKLRHYPN